jgi:hypothetical protein
VCVRIEWATEVAYIQASVMWHCQHYADKAVIVYIVHSELYRIIILPNNTIIIPSISLLPHPLFWQT